MSGRYLLGVVALLFAAQASAGEVAVSGAWARATAPGQDSAAVSLSITSQKDARIVAVSSTAAERAEIHTMQHENGMMIMREAASLALPARQQVNLGSGDHIMLVGLKQPLKAGDRVLLKLTVAYADQRKEMVS